jgi:hypothetical protein
MKENLLHYIWQFRLYDSLNLFLTNNKSILVKSVGQINNDAGPDFVNANIVVDDIIWVGFVEIHVKSSDWKKHNHQNDPKYNGVILHVVWEDDEQVYNQSGEAIPTIELKDFVNVAFLDRYERLMHSQKWIPCQDSFKNVNDTIKVHFLERLQDKAENVSDLLVYNNNDWDETFYQMLCKSFGSNVNSQPMLQLAKQLPFKILFKHKDNLVQLEALLFGGCWVFN